MNTYTFVSRRTNSLIVDVQAKDSRRAWKALEEKIIEATKLGISLPRSTTYELINRESDS